MPNAAINAVNGEIYLELADPIGEKINLNDNEPYRATYSMFITGYTPASNPTDVLVIGPTIGKVVRIKQMVIEGAASSASNIIVSLIKRSTANTGGTFTTPTPVARDSNNDANGVNISLYSANPTALGTSIGVIDGGRLNIAPPSNGSIDRLQFQYSWLNDQAIVLRPGGNEFLCVNLGGIAWPFGGSLDFNLMWTVE